VELVVSTLFLTTVSRLLIPVVSKAKQSTLLDDYQVQINKEKALQHVVGSDRNFG
jgi:hypothetical protein